MEEENVDVELEAEEEEEEEEDIINESDSSFASKIGEEEELESASFDDTVFLNAIDDNFHYKFVELVSKPTVSDESLKNLLTPKYLFGYDCTRRSNLHALDSSIVAMVAGTYVVLFNIQTKVQKYIRMTGNWTAGAIAMDSTKAYLAIGECGDGPDINIFKYPSLVLYRILRKGARKSYVSLDFSESLHGELLASVSGYPDFMLTVWIWKQELIMFRIKGFSQDITHVKFSTDFPGVIVTAGASHIRFWKMTHTFTGMKLQGTLGKFGKKEICDIEAFHELRSSKVVSSTEWGNLLLWDGSMCTMELARKGGRKCHDGAIQQIILDMDYVITIGVDGYVRMWNVEHIELAQIQEENQCFELHPTFEMKVSSNSELVSLVRTVVEHEDDEQTTMWFAQDGKGAMWKLDLTGGYNAVPPRVIMSCHGGPIVACKTAVDTALVASVGSDGSLRIHDYLTHQLICDKRFNQPATSLKWMPSCVDGRGSMIIVGFQDGVIRILQVRNKVTEDEFVGPVDTKGIILLEKAMKPHLGAVTSCAVDFKCAILATGASDSTVFFFNAFEGFAPIGFVTTPSPVTCLSWTSHPPSKLLVCCLGGEVMELQSPWNFRFDTSNTYHLTTLKSKLFRFKSMKSELLHKEDLERKEEQKKLLREAKKKENDRLAASGKTVEEDREEEDEEEEEPWQPFIPEQPSPVLCGFYDKNNKRFWLSMGAYDAGYFYKCEFGKKENGEYGGDVIETYPVEGIPDVPVTVVTMCPKEKYAVIGLQDGRIRVYVLENQDFGKLGAHFTMSVHDCEYGDVTDIAFSHDGAFLFTTGLDGNFFVFTVAGHVLAKQIDAKLVDVEEFKHFQAADDIKEGKFYSIEEAKQKAESDRLLDLAEKKKTVVRNEIYAMHNEFENLIMRNKSLPPFLQLNRTEFQMDAQIKKDLDDRKRDMLEMVHIETAVEQERCAITLRKIKSKYKDILMCDRIAIRAFGSAHCVTTYRMAKRSDRSVVDGWKTSMVKRATKHSEIQVDDSSHVEKSLEPERVSLFTANRMQLNSSLTGSSGMRVNSALNMLAIKHEKRKKRKLEWDELRASWHPASYEDPEQVAAIKEAKANTGEFVLKSASDYIVPDHLKMSVEKVTDQINILKKEIYNHKVLLNAELLDLRDRKHEVSYRLTALRNEYNEIDRLLGNTKTKVWPLQLGLLDDEVPERKYEYDFNVLQKYKENIEQGKKFAALQIERQDQLTAKLDDIRTWSNTFLVEDSTRLNDLQLLMRKDKLVRMRCRQKEICDAIFAKVNAFDADLKCLLHKRFELDIALKNADFRLWILLQSRMLLKELEKSEVIFEDNLEKLIIEDETNQDKILDLSTQLEGSKKEMARQMRLSTALETLVTEIIGNQKFTRYLFRVFRTKIKRKSKASKAGSAKTGEDDDDESDSDDDDDDDDEEEDEGDGDEDENDDDAGKNVDETANFDVDICPAECDAALYTRIIAEREKRLDIEDALLVERKLQAVLVKDVDNLVRREKYIKDQVNMAEEVLVIFQRKKQQSLNALDIAVTLKLHQISYMIRDRLPTDFSKCLILNSFNMSYLDTRCDVLIKEKHELKLLRREEHKKSQQLISSNKFIQARTAELLRKSNAMLEQKFGRKVSIKKLESIMINADLEQLKQNQLNYKIAWTKEIQHCDKAIQDLVEVNITHLNENTNIVDQMRILLLESQQQEKDLELKAKNGEEAYDRGLRRAGEVERARLIDHIEQQQDEILQLKEDIDVLSKRQPTNFQPPCGSRNPSCGY